MSTQPRPDALSWDECFTQMAFLIAQRSKDPATQAGAVIVDDQNVVIGLGYNGWPRGIAIADLPWERDGDLVNTKYAYVVHAEENAVYNTSLLPRGCRIYCTLYPCGECVKALIQVGIKEVIYTNDKHHDEPIWVAGRKMLELAGVTVRQYEPQYRLKLEK